MTPQVGILGASQLQRSPCSSHSQNACISVHVLTADTHAGVTTRTILVSVKQQLFVHAIHTTYDCSSLRMYCHPVYAVVACCAYPTDCTTCTHAASARETDEDTSVSDDVASTSGRSHAVGHQRATLCVSSQVGCIMGCTFCATGTMGIKGDLSAGEILEQLVHAQRVTHIRNVVFMVWPHRLCSS